MTRVIIQPDNAALALAVAAEIAAVGRACISHSGRFSLCLSGGSTPRAYHARLAEPGLAATIDWSRVHLYWGDERFVPADQPESNYGMARETLISRVPVPASQVHRVETERGLVPSAAHYEQVLRGAFANQETTFDLVLLGMGDDGHTASLFPGSAALHDEAHWVAAVQHHTPPPPLAPRITLTPSAINRAARVWFVVAGASKAARVQQALRGLLPPDQLPALAIQPASGALMWYLDEAAAEHLEHGDIDQGA